MSDEYEEGELDVKDTHLVPSRVDLIVPPEPPKANGQAVVSQRNQAAGLINPRGHTETHAAASAIASLQAQMQLALMNPRDEDLVAQRLHKALQRFEFAEKAVYSFPRGTTVVMGPSVYLAREMQMLWRNMLSGYSVIEDSEDSRTIRCYAWDLEANVRKEVDVTFGKKVQRKKGKDTVWVDVDERELLELTNRQAAKGERNVILSLLPDGLKRDAISWANESFNKGMRADPDAQKKKIILAFGKVGVTPKELEHLVGRPLDQVGTDEQSVKDMAFLRATFNRMTQEGATWMTVVAEKAREAGLDVAPQTAQELRELIARKAEEASPKKKKGS